jgi:SAM-dependent methyltransferase
MDEVIIPEVSHTTANLKPKDKSCLFRAIRHFVSAYGVDLTQPVLVIGGSEHDRQILSACGFEKIVLTNVEASGLAIDAENMDLPDDSYPFVFAHAVLHHCRCPQKAVGEMVRVSQKHVFFVEPNDSWVLRLLVRLRLSFPYEIAAVADNGYTNGGLRNGPIPNYIYRWTQRELRKSVFAYHPERQFNIRAYPYWDFYANERELLLRKESRVAELAKKVGPRNLLDLLHFSQTWFNAFTPLRLQGNKFFGVISKGGLQTWITSENGTHGLKKWS